MSVIAFVEKISSKSGTGRNGRPYTLYSMKLMNDTGAALPGWYQCGFDAPPCKEGDYVKLDATPKGDNFEVVGGSVKVSKNPPAKPVSDYEKSRSGSKGGGSRKSTVSDVFGEIGGYNTEDDIARMTVNASRTQAIDAVAILVESKALALPAANSKAGAAARFDIITGAIDRLTETYFAATAAGLSITEGEVADDGDDDDFDAEASDDDGFDAPDAAADDGFEDEGDDLAFG
jgi:hypothetical protein